MRSHRNYWPALCLSLSWIAAPCSAKEDIEFVQEHLPETAMDNRYATLPLWSNTDEPQSFTTELQAALSQTTAGNLAIQGPLASVAIRRQVGEDGQLGVFAFYDSLQLRADHELRPLQTLFAPATPLDRPVDAEFSNLDGTAVDYGAGLHFVKHTDLSAWGRVSWTAGLLWQRVSLRDYRFDYRILAGPQAQADGQIDFDADYAHVVPFAGMNALHTYDNWTLNAHLLAAYPAPRRAVIGHISGPGFDIHGDTAAAGNGAHFGDPSLTFGLTVTYLPMHLSVDIGALVSQALLEGWIHHGIERNLLLSFSWSH
jgi:hypothetical protein